MIGIKTGSRLARVYSVQVSQWKVVIRVPFPELLEGGGKAEENRESSSWIFARREEN